MLTNENVNKIINYTDRWYIAQIKPNGFVRLDKCMPLWTGKRYWRFSKNDANLWHLWADEYVNESEGSMHGSEYE